VVKRNVILVRKSLKGGIHKAQTKEIDERGEV